MPTKDEPGNWVTGFWQKLSIYQLASSLSPFGPPQKKAKTSHEEKPQGPAGPPAAASNGMFYPAGKCPGLGLRDGGSKPQANGVHQVALQAAPLPAPPPAGLQAAPAALAAHPQEGLSLSQRVSSIMAQGRPVTYPATYLPLPSHTSATASQQYGCQFFFNSMFDTATQSYAARKSVTQYLRASQHLAPAPPLQSQPPITAPAPPVRLHEQSAVKPRQLEPTFPCAQQPGPSLALHSRHSTQAPPSFLQQFAATEQWVRAFIW